ncbi:YeeE/YedE thiosulfate transporter family protein [Ralstonia sp. 11b]|jgi:uncharacterized protein|uniref:DUF6691 family protein n=1 Tax=Ralstonia sp. 11b TaxID=3063544 RepID=UPI00286FB5CC|nr:DUF6691 family protein [Ralstonia sp. 11b]MDR9384184.1 YeeE/YedE thiosulfate transporter family protein [Ralstonia sp. 11b]
MSFPANDAGLASGLLCGVLFGYVLENAGFGNPCKLTAQFKLSDWSVFKVMFTAIVVAALGLQILAQGGFVNLNNVFVPPAYLGAVAIGGTLLGAGFAMGGYCPGTSVVGLFSGRLDALLFGAGMVIGTGAFATLFRVVEPWTTLGDTGGKDTLAQRGTQRQQRSQCPCERGLGQHGREQSARG